MKIAYIIIAACIIILCLLSCSKQATDAVQAPKEYTHDLVYKVSTDEPVNYYVLQSKLDNSDIWADVATGFVDESGVGKFPLKACIGDYILYRIVPVYPYGRGNPSITLKFQKDQQ